MTTGATGSVPTVGTTTDADRPADEPRGPAARRVERAREPRRLDPGTGAIPVIDPGAGTGLVARLRRKLTRVVRRWQRSLGLRVSLLTMGGLTLAFAVLALVVSWQIREGFYTERVDEVLTDAAFRTARAQESFDASTATTSQEIQRVATGAVEQQVIGITSGPVGAMLMRSPGQPTAPFSEPTTSIALRELVTTEMRQAVDGGEQYWQSVALPVAGGGTDPGVVVGQSVTLPGADRYQYYLVYSLQGEESTIRIALQILGFAAAAFILVLGLIIWLVVRSVLRPVRQAALSAERLADGLLDERMEVRGRDEIARLARSFNEMAASLQHQIERLASLSALQQRFVSDVSHELRTPLTVIAGYLETLLDNVEEVNPRWRRALQQMQQQDRRMQTLLNDLLLLAKLEATDYPSDNQPVAVDLLLLSITADAQALSGNRNHRISLEADNRLQLKGSEAELRSAFSNLIFNAVKYTPDEGSIRVRWWADDAGAHLSVQDSGQGIEAKHLPRLTERFYRVDSSRAATTGGTGLGLAIVKHVLLRHRGRLEISSVVGQGSTFTCHFAPGQGFKR